MTQAPDRGRHPRGCRPRRRFCGARKQSGEDVSGIRRHTGDGCSGVGTSAGLLTKPMVKDFESPSHVALRHSRECGVCRQADRLLLTPRLHDADIRWGFQKSAVPSAVSPLLAGHPVSPRIVSALLPEGGALDPGTGMPGVFSVHGDMSRDRGERECRMGAAETIPCIIALGDWCCLAGGGGR